MDHGPYVIHEFGEAAEEHYGKHIGWLTAATHSAISWPQEDVRVCYDGDDYFLRGVRARNGHMSSPAITMRWSDGETNTVLGKMYRFASILGWYKRSYVDVGQHIYGSHAMLFSEASNISETLASSPHGFSCNYLPLIRDEQTRRALAFWREGSRLRYLHAGYSFLSFFKVIESQLSAAAARKSWLGQAIPQLVDEAGKRVGELAAQGLDVGKHLYESGRCAIAHAQFSDGRGDPDIAQDRVRLARELDIVEALARKYISEVLEVPDEMDVYRTRNRLEPLASYVSESQRNALRALEHVSRRSFGLRELRVGFAEWPEAPAAEFSNLRLRVAAVQNGIVFLQAINDAETIKINFTLDFPRGKAHIDPYQSVYSKPVRIGSAADAIAAVLFRKAVLGNGRMELWLPDGGRMDFEVVIPVNIDFGATYRDMDAEIESLRRLGSQSLNPDPASPASAAP